MCILFLNFFFKNLNFYWKFSLIRDRHPSVSRWGHFFHHLFYFIFLSDLYFLCFIKALGPVLLIPLTLMCLELVLKKNNWRFIFTILSDFLFYFFFFLSPCFFIAWVWYSDSENEMEEAQDYVPNESMTKHFPGLSGKWNKS